MGFSSLSAYSTIVSSSDKAVWWVIAGCYSPSTFGDARGFSNVFTTFGFEGAPNMPDTPADPSVFFWVRVSIVVSAI
jgi:hypothetical protein